MSSGFDSRSDSSSVDGAPKSDTPQTGPLRRDRIFKFLMPKVVDKIETSGSGILYLEGVNVSFDGFKAINDLNFYVDEGELRCLIGANGAGKTTMMDIITGKTRPDSGIVRYAGHLDLVGVTESDIALAGIGRKFQKPTVFEQLNVFENLELAMSDNKSFWWTLRHKITSEQQDRISHTANLIGLLDQQSQLAGSLSHGQKQWLEIGMLLMQEPSLLLIDEPVAGMTNQEMEKTGELLQSLAGDHTVIVVEHDMEFVRSIAKRVTVLHQGSVLAEGSMDDIQNNAEVRKVYLGE